MSANRLEGGPLDGAHIAPHSEAFIFVAPMPVGRPPTMNERPRVYAEAKAGRLLYRRMGATYLYAAQTHGPCSGCGVFMDLGHGEVTATCELCGGEVRRVPTRAR